MYPHARPLRRLERHVPDAFEDWRKEAKFTEELAQKGQAAEIRAFGSGTFEDEEAWQQFMDYVEWLNEGGEDGDRKWPVAASDDEDDG